MRRLGSTKPNIRWASLTTSIGLLPVCGLCVASLPSSSLIYFRQLDRLISQH